MSLTSYRAAPPRDPMEGISYFLRSNPTSNIFKNLRNLLFLAFKLDLNFSGFGGSSETY